MISEAQVPTTGCTMGLYKFFLLRDGEAVEAFAGQLADDLEALDAAEALCPEQVVVVCGADFIGPPTETEATKIARPILEPAKRRITTLALTLDTCRWPLGHPGEADFHYCGELPLTRQPYCEMHNAQSYLRSRRRRLAANTRSA